MPYTPPNREFIGVQHGSFRETFDPLFCQVHDELSSAYYDGTPFRTFGVLTKDQYEKFQDLLWRYYDYLFHQQQQRLPANQRIPEEEYNAAEFNNDHTIKVRKSDVAQGIIADLNAMGYDLADIKAAF